MTLVIDIIKKEFPKIQFDTFEAEHNPNLCCDIDFLGWVKNYAFGLQIELITPQSNFCAYPISDKMKANFEEFKKQFGGKVFYIFSTKINGKKEIVNKEIIEEIKQEIERLKNL